MSFNISHAQGELLAQLRPGVTTPVTLFSALELRAEVTLLIACIVPSAVSADLNVTVYHDDDGTTYTDDTAIMHETRLKLLQDGRLIQAQHPGSGIIIKPGGSLAVQTSVADEVNFSLYGITETLADRVSRLA